MQKKTAFFSDVFLGLRAYEGISDIPRASGA